jgi:hypothetical protein
MPLAKGKSKKAVNARFHEFKHGKTYARTKKKFGAAKANKQLQAVALQGKKSKKKSSKKKTSKMKRLS